MPNITQVFGKERPKLLLVASTGGHLEQLYRMARAATIDPGSHWVSFASPQTRSILRRNNVTLVPYISQRDWRRSLAVLPAFSRVLRAGNFDGVVSTGAAVAVPAFTAALMHGVPTLYIESVSRTDGPSLTGRMLATSRLTRNLWTQHSTWADRRWEYHGSVLSDYRAVRKPKASLERVFVTLGTLRDYRFDAVLDRLLELDLRDTDITWQTGCTDRRHLPGTHRAFLSAEEFDHAAQNASVVVSHAGVGSVLRLLQLGIYPVLVPRRAARGEHIDDHQEQIALTMAARGLAAVAEVSDLTEDLLTQAANWTVTSEG